jgi:hypothetical protein
MAMKGSSLFNRFVNRRIEPSHLNLNLINICQAETKDYTQISWDDYGS